VKHLIKKILREETDMSNDSPFLRNQRAKMETGGNEIEDRVRVLMLQLSKIPQLDRLKNFYLFHGNPYGYSWPRASDREAMRKMVATIDGIPKLVGGDTRHFETGQFPWLMVNTFFNNGGYQRDWKDKSDPLDLRPIIVYSVDANYKEPAVNYGSIWGTVYDADSENEAGEHFMEDPFKYEDERENQDQDDHGDIEVYEIESSQPVELKFTKGVVGLS
jgi:hypothetical protein